MLKSLECGFAAVDLQALVLHLDLLVEAPNLAGFDVDL